jgi:predicted Holliday junction resolvase-like endonuclease
MEVQLFETLLNSTPVLVSFALVVIYMLWRVIKELYQRLNNQSDSLMEVTKSSIEAQNKNSAALEKLDLTLKEHTNYLRDRDNGR